MNWGKCYTEIAVKLVSNIYMFIEHKSRAGIHICSACIYLTDYTCIVEAINAQLHHMITSFN